MSKKINLATMNQSVLNTLSDFHRAYKGICEYTRQRKATVKDINERLEKYKAEHKPEEEGYSLSQFEQELGKVQAWYDDVTKPLKEAQKPAMSLLDKDVYYAYAVSMLKGSHKAKGKIDIQSKDGKKSFTVTKTYYDQMKDFLESMGISKTDDKTAMDKAAQSLAVRCGGMVKDNNGNYLKLKNVSAFRQIVILAFLQYAIIDRRALVILADDTLALNTGSEEA